MSLRSIIALSIGLAIGLSLADVDHVFFFLRHRSVVTHSVLLPFLAYLLVKQPEQRRLQFGVVGLSIGMAIHLSFDLFPVAWRGYALVNAPLVGSLGSTLSMLWLLGNIIACGYLALMLLESRIEAYTTLCATAIAASLVWGVETGTSIWPLIVLVFALAVVTLLPNQIVDGRKIVHRTLQRMRAMST